MQERSGASKYAKTTRLRPNMRPLPGSQAGGPTGGVPKKKKCGARRAPYEAKRVSATKLQGFGPTGGVGWGSQAGGPTGGVFKKKMRGPQGPVRSEARKCAISTRLRPKRRCWPGLPSRRPNVEVCLKRKCGARRAPPRAKPSGARLRE